MDNFFSTENILILFRIFCSFLMDSIKIFVKFIHCTFFKFKVTMGNIKFIV